jgi:hypothetical protein
MLKYKSLTSQNFRTIIDMKNIEFCPIVANIQKYPNFDAYLSWFQRTFPGAVHPCPYKEFNVINASHGVSTGKEKDKINFSPNGIMICEKLSNVCRHFVKFLYNYSHVFLSR